MSASKLLTVAFCSLAFLVLSRAPAAATFPASGGGEAVAASLKDKVLGTTVANLGPLAPVFVCTAEVPGSESNSVLSLNSAPYVLSGTAVDTISTSRSANGAAIQSKSVIQNVNLLSGVIQAAALKAVANSNATLAGGAKSTATGTSFLGLVVNGVAYGETPAPNTMVPLPGIGYVVINEQITSAPTNKTITNLTVNMLHVVVSSSNSLGIPVGASLIVGHAYSHLTLTALPFDVFSSSFGFLSKDNEGSTVETSGPFAPATICGQGSTGIDTSSGTSPFGTFGVMVDTAAGSIETSAINGMATSKVATTNILGGLITAGLLESVATVTYNGAPSATGSSTFANLTVLGLPIGGSPPANTNIDLPGIGYIMLNEQNSTITSTSVEEDVVAMHVYITLPNPLLPVGSDLVVGSAKSLIRSY
jgi:hypothetical protein